MSYGVIKSSDRPEEYRLAVNGAPIEGGDFQNLGNLGEGSSTHDVVTKGFGVPPEAYGKVQEAFAEFLREIQEISFVPVSLLVSSVQKRLTMAEIIDPHAATLQDSASVYCYTLSMQSLKNTVKIEFEKFLCKVIELLPPSEAKDIFNSLFLPDGQQQNEQEQVLSMRMHSSYDTLLNNEDFLTPAVRSSLDKIEDGIAEVVNARLKSFANSVLNRAELSLPSTLRDADSLRQEQTREMSYSTLNPTDLMNTVRSQLDFLLPGLIFALPERTRQQLMDKTKA